MFGMGSAANAMPPLQPFRSLRMRMYEVGPFGGPAAVYAINAASSLRLAEHLHSSFKKFIHLDVPRLKDVWLERFLNLWGTEVVQLLEEMCPSTLLFLNFSGGREGKHKDPSYSTTPARNPTSRRQWTNIILALNIMIYVAQLASQGKLILWGAKVNSLINEGQIWRLITSSFLHANAVHLMVNCFSLNSIGPAVEGVSGPRRFLAVYFTSALTSSAVSYWFSKAPAVGASGAIFGLVGSVAVFTLRHRGLIGGAKEDLKHIAKVIILNMAIGLMSRDIDNWGHLGGLLGGIVTSWIIGPAWKYESTTIDGRKIFSDRAPIFHIIKRNR